MDTAHSLLTDCLQHQRILTIIHLSCNHPSIYGFFFFFFFFSFALNHAQMHFKVLLEYRKNVVYIYTFIYLKYIFINIFNIYINIFLFYFYVFINIFNIYINIFLFYLYIFINIFNIYIYINICNIIYSIYAARICWFYWTVCVMMHSLLSFVFMCWVFLLVLKLKCFSLTLWPLHLLSTWSWPPSPPTAWSWPWSSTSPERIRPPWPRDWWGQRPCCSSSSQTGEFVEINLFLWLEITKVRSEPPVPFRVQT